MLQLETLYLAPIPQCERYGASRLVNIQFVNSTAKNLLPQFHRNAARCDLIFDEFVGSFFEFAFCSLLSQAQRKHVDFFIREFIVRFRFGAKNPVDAFTIFSNGTSCAMKPSAHGPGAFCSGVVGANEPS